MKRVLAAVGIPLAAAGFAALHGCARSTSLDGVWSFVVDSTAQYTIETVVEQASWRPVRVPLGWQAQCADLREYQGVAWYRREVEARRPAAHQAVVLRFGAVDYRTDVYVNRRLLATHEGGYTPFEVSCGEALIDGMNEIILRVMDPAWTADGTEGINYQHIPHGKQSWYVQTSGPWQSISMEVVPARRVLRARFTPDISGELQCEVVLSGGEAGTGRGEIVLEISDPSGTSVLSTIQPVARGSDTLRWSGVVGEPRLWSPENPHLYTASVRLGENQPLIERFGFRKLEARDGRLLLNGEPFYMIGALDQDFYPETIYSTPSRDILREEMHAAKAMGLNTLRCHIKVPDPMYLETADEVGLLVWYEIPNWDVWTPQAAGRSRETLDRMLDRDWNHPSLVAISIINESWGIDLGDITQRQWLAAEVAYARQRAPGRLIVDNSACWGNYHLDTDIADWHTYYAVPERKDEFRRTIIEYAARPEWLFSPYGDAVIRGDEPLVLSEFGTWGLPDVPSPAPWWMERGFFDNYVVHPKGFDRRFTEFGLRSVFGSYGHLAVESQRAQSDALKYQIEEIRAARELSGYVITEFTDIMWECNGLLDMWRRPKECRSVLPMVQQQDVIIVRPHAYSVEAGDSARFQLLFSHFSAADLAGASVAWSWNGAPEVSVPLPPCMRGDVVELPPATAPVGECSAPLTRSLSVRVLSRGGGELARNVQEVDVYPASASLAWPSVAFHDPGANLTGLGSFAASRQADTAAAPPVTVTDVLDEKILALLRSGSRVLCLVDSATVTPPGFPLTVIARDSAYYDGNWASVMNWVRPTSPVIGWLPEAPRMGFAPAAIGLPFVLGGVTGEWMADVHAGMFIGWIHGSAAYIAQMRVGAGLLLLCSVPVARGVGNDPFATYLFNTLVQYAAGGAMHPRRSWNP